MLTIEEVKALPRLLRLYWNILRISAGSAELGAKFRLEGSDESWTTEQEQQWYEFCDEADPYWYALSQLPRP